MKKLTLTVCVVVDDDCTAEEISNILDESLGRLDRPCVSTARVTKVSKVPGSIIEADPDFVDLLLHATRK